MNHLDYYRYYERLDDGCDYCPECGNEIEIDCDVTNEDGDLICHDCEEE